MNATTSAEDIIQLPKEAVIYLSENACLKILCTNEVTSHYVDGLNDPEVHRFLVTPRQHVQSLQSVKSFVQENLDADDSALFGFFADSELRGTLRLHNATAKNVWMGLAVFDKNYWGQGWGRQMVVAATRYVAEELHIQQISAGIALGNKASINAFESAGFACDPSKQSEYEGEPINVWVFRAPRFQAIEDERRTRIFQILSATQEPVDQFRRSLHRHPELMAQGNAAYEFAISLPYEHPGMSSEMYLAHPLRVASLYLEQVKNPNAFGLKTALIHNLLEVGNVDEQWVRETIEDDVFLALKLLTVNRKLQWDEHYKEAYYAAISEAPAYVAEVKVLDKLDNLYLLCLNPDDEIRRKYLAEIERWIVPLARRISVEMAELVTCLVADNQQLGHRSLTYWKEFYSYES